MQKKSTPYAQLKKLTHRMIDISKAEDWRKFSRSFNSVLIELSNDMLSTSGKYGRYNYNIERYLKILATNMSNYRRYEFLKNYRDFLSSLDVKSRIKLMRLLSEFLVTMAFGRNERHFESLDKKNGKDEKQKEEAHYPYIAAPLDTFLQILYRMYKVYGEREAFVDVGCGIGDKVFLAWMSGLFKECVGIEYEGFTSAIGREVTERLSQNNPHIYLERAHIFSTRYGKIGKDNPKVPIDIGIINANAFNVGYWRFDTVYLYHPIVDEEGMTRLYKWVFKTMGAKSIMIEIMQDRGLELAISEFNDQEFKFGLNFIGRSISHYYKTTTNKIRAREF